MASRTDFRSALTDLLPQLRAFARFLARDAARADDLVQETVLRALEHEAGWQPGTSLRAWLFRILRNLFLDQQRRRGVESRGLARLPPGAGVQPPAQAGVAELNDLAAAVALLPPAQREALMLVAALEMDVAEAAAIIGAPPGTVKARVFRARAALARRFGRGRDG